MRKGRTNRPRPIEEKVACPDLTGGARRMRRKGRPLQRGRGGAIRGCSDCRQREVIERQDRWFRGLAEFFASKGEQSVKSVFCGGVYLAKHTSQPASVRASPASECAQQAATPSVGKARWHCRQIAHLRAACGSGGDAFLLCGRQVFPPACLSFFPVGSLGNLSGRWEISLERRPVLRYYML